MPNFVFVIAAIGLSILSWGLYGPLIRWGTSAMGGDHWLPFICVGIAYFAMAVAPPVAVLLTRGEKGKWTLSGAIWSLAAGAAGAVGALGVILAFNSGGRPIYVMPLVFGCAPVVNTFATMFVTRTFKQANPMFLAGLILVVTGAVCVLTFKPNEIKKPAPAPAAEASAEATAPHAADSFGVAQLTTVGLFIAMTALCWGVYGPVLHTGQMKMQGSRLRPFMCVGIAYFVIGVLFPSAMLQVLDSHGEWTTSGTFWSLAGGAAGAAGALGIILSFTFGGRPVYVMPLVFGGAPVVNTFVTLATSSDLEPTNPLFYAGLIVVAAGAVAVLVFAPKAPVHAPAK